MNSDRRKFFTSIALGVGATAFPNFVEDFEKFITKTVGDKIILFPYRWVLFDLFILMNEQKNI